MFVDWDEVMKAIYPIKDYEDLCRRWQESFAYPFVRETFNFTMLELANYTQLVLGGDSRGRYTEYALMLNRKQLSYCQNSASVAGKKLAYALKTVRIYHKSRTPPNNGLQATPRAVHFYDSCLA